MRRFFPSKIQPMSELLNGLLIGVIFPLLLFATVRAWASRGFVIFFMAAAGGWLFVTESLYALAWLYNGGGFTLENLYHLRLSDSRDGLIYHFWKLMAAAALLAMLTAGVIALYRWGKRRWNPRTAPRWRALWIMLLAAGICLPTPVREAGLVLWKFRANRHETIRPLPLAAYARLGIRPPTVQRRDVRAAPGKNLLWIYLESVENAFCDETLFPGLAPELRDWRATGADFTQVTPSPGAGSTFSALYAAMLGSVMTDVQLEFSPWQGGAMLDTDIGSELGSFSWILHQAGYQQIFMMGAAANFTGTDIFLYRQGFDRIWSSNPQRRADCLTSIGCYDRELFAAALQEYRRLQAAGQPFHLAVRTLDTHPADGFFPADGTPYRGAKQYPFLNALHNSIRELGLFLNEIRALPGYENLCVVLTTDHPLPSGAVLKELAGSERKLIFCAPNSPRELGNNRPGSTVDLGPTVLDLMQVRHNYVFPLGRSLLSGETSDIRWQDPEFHQVLGNLILLNSRLHTTSLADSELTFQEHPFPAIKLGDAVYPLYVNHFSTDLPRANEAVVIPVGETSLATPQFLLDSRYFERYCQAHGAAPRGYIIFGRGPLPEKNGIWPDSKLHELSGGDYFLIRQHADGSAFRQHAARPEELKIPGGKLR